MKQLPEGQYDFKKTEEKILDFWLSKPFYKPEYKPERKETFSIVLPPPNANGTLHLGHMSGYSYQDLMGRYHRMKGKKVLLLPGKDHAGIQTEVVFEKLLQKEGQSKFKMGREKFYEECYKFCMDASSTARGQEKKLGLSADFDRELFTLDPKIVNEVLTTFVQMYDDGLIYRGKRLINWSPKAHSALADIDTEYVDAKMKFVYFKYGFLEPDEKALELKKNYENKEVELQVSKTEDGFYYSEIDNIPVEIIEPANEDQKFKIIGLFIRLNGKHSLIASLTEDPTSAQMEKIFLNDVKKYGSTHFRLFKEYKEDEFYNNGFILGTVRPETKFGDTAVVANSKDERYKEWIGKEVEVKTLLGTSKIKVIGDDAIDKDFGTGMMKLTPAHAKEDWDIAQRHPETLPEKQVINFDGKLNHLAGKYEGLKAAEARDIIIEDMKKSGMLVYVNENYETRIQIDERTKGQIEPLISYQWFLNTAPLKKKAKELVESGVTHIMPKGKEKVYLDWMNTPEDWCITRQLWWGYRIPVWYKEQPQEYITETGEVKEKIGDTLIENPSQYKDLMKVQIDSPGKEFTQDEDVLDTWFSSGQWPFATLNCKEGDLAQFYPTQVLETGWDIVIFWVTRMMLLCPYKMEKKATETLSDDKLTPFANVYLHGLVLDKHGVKMSKSKNNGIDPYEMMDKYGTDALRMSFIMGNSAGQNYSLYDEKIKGFRNFNNKLWNASKFVMMNLEDFSENKLFGEIVKTNSIDEFKELLKNNNVQLEEDDLNELLSFSGIESSYDNLIDKFKFGLIAEKLYDNFWHEYCDIYLEKAKKRVWKDTENISKESRIAAQATLLYVLKTNLRLLHPFIPFITEEIWQHLAEEASYSEAMMYS